MGHYICAHEQAGCELTDLALVIVCIWGQVHVMEAVRPEVRTEWRHCAAILVIAGECPAAARSPVWMAGACCDSVARRLVHLAGALRGLSAGPPWVKPCWRSDSSDVGSAMAPRRTLGGGGEGAHRIAKLRRGVWLPPAPSHILSSCLCPCEARADAHR